MNANIFQIAPHPDWTGVGRTEHVVQLYETDEYLARSIHGFVSAGLRSGDAAIVLATPEHRGELQRRLEADGLDMAALTGSGRFVSLDAGTMLSTFLRDGWPQETLFEASVGGLLDRAARDGRDVRCVGEMVALLLAMGRQEAVLRLEELWNVLHEKHSFSLLCIYPMAGFPGDASTRGLADICGQHARVIPAESYSTLATAEDRLGAIAVLQQKAASLEAEVAERRAAADRFRFLAESMPQKVFTALPAGDMDYVNEEWAAYMGNKGEETRRAGWSAVVHPDDAAETDRRWRECVTTGEEFAIEHRLRRADGSYRWHLSRAHAMRDAGGRVTLWVGSSTDVDEGKQREAALAQSIRHRDEFLSAISHDLKTPLTVLQGQAQLLHRRAGRGTLDSKGLRKGLEQIEGRARHMAELVDELLDVTRLRAGEELQLDRHMVDLVALVQDTIADHRGTMRDHRVALVGMEEQLIGRWDRRQLRRVVENLLSNAVKYTPDGGEITIELSREVGPGGASAVLVMRDHGIGIPGEDLPHIFERFYRGRNASSANVGTGLGLAGARQIVEQHGGTIAAGSGDGGGSTFTVRLPLDEPAGPGT